MATLLTALMVIGVSGMNVGVNGLADIKVKPRHEEHYETIVTTVYKEDKMFQKFDYNGGRTFVVGDIHGEFDLLMQKLAELRFDIENDHLFSVGDLVDRGPQSADALYYLEQPWFHAVRGNHEQMVIDAGGTSWHVGNGGQWFNDLPEDGTRRKYVLAFNELPYFIEFISPSGRKIGVVHAAVPPYKQVDNAFLTDWDKKVEMLRAGDWGGDKEVIWDRWQVGRAKKHYPRLHKVGDNVLREFNVENIDHVYLGHTPMKEPLNVGNMTWLDTGAFATGKLTVIEVE